MEALQEAMTDQSGTSLQYPPAGTRMARIIECLEAEAATLQEIRAYIRVPEQNVAQVKGLLTKLQHRGLVRKCGDMFWELVDPESASIVYFKN